jgi:hypothetical protein
MSKTITISDEAANYLAWFIEHECYGDTASQVIIDNTKEWFLREGKLIEEYIFEGDHEEVPPEGWQ